MHAKKYGLITRSDIDGLMCAILLKELGILDSIKFVHPKDVQYGKVEVTENDILTNLPYVPAAHLCFDHHASEEIRTGGVAASNYILKPGAASAARVLYNHYGGAQAFPNISEQMLQAVDQADSANFSKEEILDPQGWVLMSFLMDPRTGLGRFREFRISNYQLMMQLIDYCRHHSIEETLLLPDVRERVDLYREHQEQFQKQIRRCTTVRGKVAVLDLRNEGVIYAGNRFVIYALFPECTVSIHVMWGLNKQNTVLAVGKSILNRSSRVRIGDLLLTYGGGGHDAAGTCQVPHEQADQVLRDIVQVIDSTAVSENQPVPA